MTYRFKYTVTGDFYGTVEADSPEEANEKAYNAVRGADPAAFSDTNYILHYISPSEEKK